MRIIDNTNHLFGDDLKSSLKSSSRLKVAAAYFSIYAYEALKRELSKIKSLEFIFTAPTFIPNEATGKIRKEKREFYIPKADRESALYGSEFEILLRNKLTQRAIARECADWIRNKATFKSNKTNSFMQQFACIENGENDVSYSPIGGFTAVDLGYEQGNAVSNYINRIEDKAHTSQYSRLFQEIWEDEDKLENVTDIICENIESVYQENSPERIYFLILYNIFTEFLENIDEDVLPNDLTGYKDSAIWNKLYNFQRDAAVGIINKLETYNGCILADSVGLGKTFTALAVVKYYELRNKSVLVLCPKKLSDNWQNYNANLKTNIFATDRFNYDVLCHTDLSRTSGKSLGMPLSKVNWGNYDLVVIDESHNFRNDDAFRERETRYQKLMNQVIRSGVKTKVLMLSATPVNNRFNDLKNQLALAYEGESDNLNTKLQTERRVEEIFRRAQKVFNDWSKLPPEGRTAETILGNLDFDFFNLLDSVTIARSRKHIETFYDTKDIGKFPERKNPKSYHCRLTARDDVMTLNEIFQQLSAIKMVVYAPISYIFADHLKKYEDKYDTEFESGRRFRQADREHNLQTLMTTNLLKRLESSVEAFRITLKSLAQNIESTLDTINKYEEGRQEANVSDFTDGFADLSPDEDDLSDMEELSVGDKIQINLKDVDTERWKRDLLADLSVIKELTASMEKITPEDDEKLQHLKNHVFNKIDNPINANNKKVIIFTAFADTANYLYKHISEEALNSHKLHSGMITGRDTPKSTLGTGYDFHKILTLFSPISQEKTLIMPEEEGVIDILICTDCISEGQNLQDCDYLINYDIHWNPVRIIQRFGRIDRIGSLNSAIQLVNYWPDITLDAYINLKERVENRMVIADVSATGDDNVLRHESGDLSYRKEQLRRLQDGNVIEMEDVKVGISITDLGLNDFRMDLLNYIKTNGDMSHSPKGLHAILAVNEDLNLKPGVIYVLKNRNQDVNINQQNRLHPYYLIYISTDGEVIVNHTEVKRLLDLIRKSCKGQAEPIKSLCRQFNKETEDGRMMEPYSKLLNQSIQAMMSLKDEKDIDSLFTGGTTSALSGTISGLDDFELIAFLVVKEGVT